ncbi:MAG: site-2 protease family protein [Thermoanaerobaculia bacterium]|nr:site-2 protease family protein [Thermoanaerobaculia bacterium]
MFGRRFELFRVFGVPLRIDLSWFVVAALVAWSLATGFFPSTAEGLDGRTYWAMGIVGAVALFASVVLHELAHALVARSYGLPIRGITLFIFGGVAEMEREPPSPAAEFAVAIAGPLASLGISVVCFAASALGGDLGLGGPAVTVLGYLAGINLILVVFNMVPAFPLDGGRVLRSALWRARDDLRWATRVTSMIGGGFGLFLIAVGVWRVVANGDLFGGLWMFLIGLFLRNAAQMSYQQLLVRRSLEGEPVRRFMVDDPVSVPRSISVEELVERYIYRHHHKLYPVVDGERLLGCVTTRDVKQLPREEWTRQSVGAIARPLTEENSVKPETDAMDALAQMRRTGFSRLMVVEEGRLLGIITLKDMLDFLALKVELEGAQAAGEAA